MKKIISAVLVIIFLMSVFASMASHGQAWGWNNNTENSENQDKQDKNLSPYFIVLPDPNSPEGENPETESLPLKETSADVNITGNIADVTVKQVYENTGKKPIEAIYVFPASTRSAVYALTMKIADREIKAQIQEKQKAREQYEQAKQEGKSASLLEQKRPNVFQMNVANIMPKDIIQVELKYTELLEPENGVYEFVYPTVVGPRYSNTPEDSPEAKEESWIQNPFISNSDPSIDSDKKATYSFDIKTNISTGIPIKELKSENFKTDIKFNSNSNASVTLDSSEKNKANKDYILKYRLSDNKIESGVLLYEDNNLKEKFFVLMLQPPLLENYSKHKQNKNTPNREYIFIVDVSGSMYGFPLDTSKKLIKNIIKNLTPKEKFNIVFFSGGSEKFSESSVFATSENIKKAMNMLDSQTGGGGTELLQALEIGLSVPKDKKFSRSFVLITDGYISAEKSSFELINKNLENSNFFTFGIGSSVNRYLIEGLARVGNGKDFIVLNSSEANNKSKEFYEYIQAPFLTDIKIKYPESLGVSFDQQVPDKIGDLFANKPIIITGKYTGNINNQEKFVITGKIGEKNFEQDLSISEAEIKNSKQEKNSAVKYIWARKKIASLVDYINLFSEQETKSQVTSLGLKYNLMTPYTSFVAIDNQVRNKDGKVTTVKQPLPLPEGVSDYAVGGGYGGGYAPMASPPVKYSYGGGGASWGNFAMNGAMPEYYKAEERVDYEESEPVRGMDGYENIQNIKILSLSSKEISEAELEKYLESHAGDIISCINKNILNKNTEIILEGEVSAETGKVISLKIISGVNQDKSLFACLFKTISSWEKLLTSNNKLSKNITFKFKLINL